MNRRHFLAAVLPAVLGGTALNARAEDKPEPTASPHRIKSEVSRLKPSAKFGDTPASTIVVVANEHVETYAAFMQVNTLEGYDPQTNRPIPVLQAIGSSLRVTPRVEVDGKITLDTTVQFEEATPGAAPVSTGAVLTTTNSVTTRRTVGSGQAIMLDNLIKGVKPHIQLTATLLDPR